MKIKSTKAAAIALAFSGLALAIPAAAAESRSAPQIVDAGFRISVLGNDTVEHRRNRGHRHANDRRNDQRGNGYGRGNYGEPVYRSTRIWRGRDGHYYCRRENGTTGLLVGAAVGGLLGNEIAGRGDRTLGAILGAAGGAILGRSIDRSNSRCR